MPIQTLHWRNNNNLKSIFAGKTFNAMPKITKFFELKAAIMGQDLLENDAAVSICIDCARHDSLKRTIQADCIPGTCGVCCRDDVTVRNPDNVEPMVMLCRALIRFYWEEFEYNSHFGGDNLLCLFNDEQNPVLNPVFPHTYWDELDHLLGDPPYPDWDKGISIYAGFLDGHRMMNRAIAGSQPPEISDLRKRLDSSNFAALLAELDALFDPFVDELDVIIPKDEIWFRARKGVSAEFHRYDGSFGGEIVRQPHIGNDIGPSPIPGNGRLNREGFPVLYLGTTAYTALAEIRPHPGHYVSVGGFRILEDLKVADFGADISRFAQNEVRLEMYGIVHAFDRMMSTPVTPDDTVRYLITQLLAEVLKARGYDGVQFRSSVSDGKNLCIFEPSKARFENGHSAVNYVKSLVYEAPEVPSISVPIAGDYKLDR
ncbi:RES family NAD+ phosphorylase [Sulfitobacter sp. B30-2]|uniref:RES family NAD+ phosphorylase n=1 Tax=Sulfitobacter sp. B30-2 TaxID=2785912 RepID=UPI0018CD8292|nr:RES family NAD+ phosphorylase [Sulfitobacter sp. B30-2]QPO08270.1 RES family NAD+ phosphorylase [Sulfitobacter sp. B30-2]